MGGGCGQKAGPGLWGQGKGCAPCVILGGGAEGTPQGCVMREELGEGRLAVRRLWCVWGHRIVWWALGEDSIASGAQSATASF